MNEQQSKFKIPRISNYLLRLNRLYRNEILVRSLHSAQGKQTMELFKSLNEGGTTIVQVTHSETNAAYGNRVIRLQDGWIAKD